MSAINSILDFHNPLFYIMIAWSIMWKGIALWHAARQQSKVWFIVLLLVNTVGLLEIFYLIFIRKKEVV